VRIEVRLFATLTRYLPKDSHAGSTYLDVAEGSTVADVVEALGIPADFSRIVLVNDQDADEARRLGDRDVVTLFPPLAGGAVALSDTLKRCTGRQAGIGSV
jgi:molybdopterin converting factor small subunit